MELTQEEIKNFNLNGFLILKSFAENITCDNILKTAKKHLENRIEPIESETQFLQSNQSTQTVRRLRQVYDREEVFKKWMHNAKIRPILQQLLKDEPILILSHHNSIMTKMPNDSSRTPWHQDFRYWNYEKENLVSIWLSLDDETIENGLLEFIPGSHTIAFDKEQFDEKCNFIDNNAKNEKLIKTSIHTNLQKGDVVLFHCKTLHHANKNSTNKPKISFVYTARAFNNAPIKNTRSDFKEVIL